MGWGHEKGMLMSGTRAPLTGIPELSLSALWSRKWVLTRLWLRAPWSQSSKLHSCEKSMAVIYKPLIIFLSVSKLGERNWCWEVKHNCNKYRQDLNAALELSGGASGLQTWDVVSQMSAQLALWTCVSSSRAVSMWALHFNSMANGGISYRSSL